MNIDSLISSVPLSQDVIVLKGLPRITLSNLQSEKIVDAETFLSEGVNNEFDKAWFTKVFMKIIEQSNERKILTYAQFIGLQKHLDPAFFVERAHIIYDNLRTYLPLDHSEFRQQTLEHNLEERHEDLPPHHVEHLRIEDKFFYISRTHDIEFSSTPIFTERLILKGILNDPIVKIDYENDTIGLELFLHDLIENKSASNLQLLVHLSKKENEFDSTRLELINGLLADAGYGCFLSEKEPIKVGSKVSDIANSLLKEYWGDSAEFRNLEVYSSPDTSTTKVSISQGEVVDVIINEIDSSQKGNIPRDIFLTAPTGAGKSLLFQIPAFYTSSIGGICIVVSPLIALMKDQVKGVIDRSFSKVAYINSELTLHDRERTLIEIRNGEIDLVYLSPELLLSYNINYFIGERKLMLLVVDEAHLITTWGRDFRVDYWFLGNHLRKIRKYSDLKFPIVAVTATAVYGGSNDMVFDGISSLELNNPHMYIGVVRRDDITFYISNHEIESKGYEEKKLKQSAEFLAQLKAKSDVKTLVYAPYVKHVQQLAGLLQILSPNSCATYFGSMDKTIKENAYNAFLSGEKSIMISTKAFGMGIDIPDIQVVYHHAPSGLLPDYIQEIGRLARKTELNGYALLNYSHIDKLYSNILHGMSSLKHSQLHEVIRKIYALYIKEKHQNLLVSIDDFKYIFTDVKDNMLTQRVLSAFMMIEKDYLTKFRFNVFIARPKQIFTTVFARLNSIDFEKFKKIKNINYTEIKYSRLQEKNYHIIKLNLDDVWKNHYPKENFPKLKYEFYCGNLFSNCQISISPQLRFELNLNQDHLSCANSLQKAFDLVSEAFQTIGKGYFTKEHFEYNLEKSTGSKELASKLSEFILNYYSSPQKSATRLYDQTAFLARRKHGYETKYRLMAENYKAEFSALLKKLTVMESSTSTNYRFLTVNDNMARIYNTLGQWIEILSLGNYHVTGGENPMVFLRINDPKKLYNDSASTYYKNTLLTATLNRHYISNQIFDHFFSNDFSNSDRWDFIESYFLGTELDDLIEEYPAKNQQSSIDLVNSLMANEQVSNFTRIDPLDKKIHNSPPAAVAETKSGKFYTNSNVTIAIDGVLKTKTVNQWVVEEPFVFHKHITQNDITIYGEIKTILISKIRKDHEYFKLFEGTNKTITIPNIGTMKAKIIMLNHPEVFYKWYLKNRDAIHIPSIEFIKLLSSIEKINPSLLNAKDRKLLSNK